MTLILSLEPNALEIFVNKGCRWVTSSLSRKSNQTMIYAIFLPYIMSAKIGTAVILTSNFSRISVSARRWVSKVW